jgi:hypothetical protein
MGKSNRRGSGGGGGGGGTFSDSPWAIAKNAAASNQLETKDSVQGIVTRVDEVPASTTAFVKETLENGGGVVAPRGRSLVGNVPTDDVYDLVENTAANATSDAYYKAKVHASGRDPRFIASIGDAQFMALGLDNSLTASGQYEADPIVLAKNQSLGVSGDDRMRWYERTAHLPGPAVNMGGVIVGGRNYADANNSTTVETDLHSFTIAANQLKYDGETLEIDTTLTFAANANNKQVRLKWGASTVYDSTLVGQNGGVMVIRCRVTRTGATTQRIKAEVLNTATAPLFADGVFYATGGETLSGAVVLKVTGQSGTASSDVTAKISEVRWFPAA